MKGIVVLLVISIVLLRADLQSASAQEHALDGRLVPSGIDTFVVSYAGTVIGRGITERTRIATTTGSQLLQVYTWRSAGDGDVIVDSLYSFERSLQTLREVRVVQDTVIEVTFGDADIRVLVRAGGRSLGQNAVPTDHRVYSSAALESIAAAAPLAAGFKQDIHLYYTLPASYGIVSTRLEVQGSESINDRVGSEREAWVVSVNTPGGGTTYWIDKLDRHVLKYDTREGPAVIEFRR